MAIVVTNKELSEEFTLASARVQVVDFKGDTSYPTGGTGGITALFGFSKLYVVVPLSHKGYVWEYNDATDKLQFYQQPAAAAAGAMPEVPNTTNLSGVVYRALLIGE